MTPSLSYPAAIAYVQSFTNYELTPGVAYSASNYDLRRMELLLAHFDSPHRKIPAVHIAGTRGKGSTAAMAASVLTAAGYRTGLYTSPHLHTFRERIQVDGRLIVQEGLATLVEHIHPEVEAINREARYGRLTTFELLTALAFLYFAQQRVDFQVLEVGMGGRLDATNVVIPRICCITNISLDHTEVLGSTISLIAREKAGIVKPGVPVISGPQTPEAEDVIQAVCQEKDAPLFKVGKDIRYERGQVEGWRQEVVVHGRLSDYYPVLPLLGAHQLENCATAIGALEVLEEQGVELPYNAFLEGLMGVRWPCRLDILQERPLIVADGAQNAYSARRLREAVQEYLRYEKCWLVMGTSSDKDRAGMAAELAPLAGEVFATRSRHPRASSPEQVAQEFLKLGKKASIWPTVREALQEAQRRAQDRDLILVTGSLFVGAEAIEAVRGLEPEL